MLERRLWGTVVAAAAEEMGAFPSRAPVRRIGGVAPLAEACTLLCEEGLIVPCVGLLPPPAITISQRFSPPSRFLGPGFPRRSASAGGRVFPVHFAGVLSFSPWISSAWDSVEVVALLEIPALGRCPGSPLPWKPFALDSVKVLIFLELAAWEAMTFRLGIGSYYTGGRRSFESVVCLVMLVSCSCFSTAFRILF